MTLLFGRAQLAAGADALRLADHGTGHLVRGTMYRDFLQPIPRRLTRVFACPGILHICRDTLDRIARVYGVSPQRLAERNRLKPGDPLRTGTVLVIPLES